MTTEQRLAELRSVAAELSQVIDKLSLLHELTDGVLAEARTAMADVANMTEWAIQGK